MLDGVDEGQANGIERFALTERPPKKAGHRDNPDARLFDVTHRFRGSFDADDDLAEVSGAFEVAQRLA